MDYHKSQKVDSDSEQNGNTNNFKIFEAQWNNEVHTA